MSTKNTKSAKKGNLAKNTRPVSSKNTATYRDSGNGRLLSRKTSSGTRSSSTVSSENRPTSPRHQIIKASVDSAGRILVPAKLRRALDLEPGDGVNLELKGDVLEIRSLDDAIDSAQALVRKYVPKKRSLVDELIKDRRAEAEKEP